MKITAIRVHALRSPLEQPFAFSQGWVQSRGATLVEVSTDQGITGWGEALCQGLQPPEIVASAVRHALAPLVLGADPLEPEVLWHRMYHHTRDYGQKGAVIGAISALDIAFWDIAGKARGEPVARLLGGRFRTRVQAYATGFYRLRGQGEAGRLAQEAERHVAQGFGAFKVKLGFGIEDDLAVMRAIREVAGAIRSVIRADDLLFRWGGDEFLVLMFKLHEDEATRRMQSLNQILEENCEQWISASVKITVSSGVCGFESLQDLGPAIESADHAMYGGRKQRRSGLADRSEVNELEPTLSK